jgi:hypothetical protein
MTDQERKTEEEKQSDTTGDVYKKIRERNQAITKQRDKDMLKSGSLTLELARKAGMCK